MGARKYVLLNKTENKEKVRYETVQRETTDDKIISFLISSADYEL